jgi:hypothetical protein
LYFSRAIYDEDRGYCDAFIFVPQFAEFAQLAPGVAQEGERQLQLFYHRRAVLRRVYADARKAHPAIFEFFVLSGKAT